MLYIPPPAGLPINGAGVGYGNQRTSASLKTSGFDYKIDQTGAGYGQRIVWTDELGGSGPSTPSGLELRPNQTGMTLLVTLGNFTAPQRGFGANDNGFWYADNSIGRYAYCDYGRLRYGTTVNYMEFNEAGEVKISNTAGTVYTSFKSTSSATATAGAGVLPGAPVAFLDAVKDGTPIRIPYYNA